MAINYRNKDDKEDWEGGYKLDLARFKNNKRGKAKNIIHPAMIKGKTKFLKLMANRNMMLE